MPEVLLGGRWLLAIVLIAAGVAKLRWHSFGDRAAAIRSYAIVPERLVMLVATGLPWYEIALGLLLVAGVLLPVAAAVTAATLAVFATAVGWHRLRGRKFACGCGAGRGALISWRLAVRDAGLAVIAAAVAAGPGGALAVWPGPGGQGSSAPASQLVPVPMLMLLAALGYRLVQSGRDQRQRRASGGTV